MATDAWSGISLDTVAANGNLTQLYPTWVSAGVAKAGSTAGQLLRRPQSGNLHSVEVRPIGANGGYLELWDISGEDAGADVSSLTAITNAQLVALQAQGLAKLIYRQDLTGTVAGNTTKSDVFRRFSRGLAARFVGPVVASTCELNLVCEFGFCKVESRGGY